MGVKANQIVRNVIASAMQSIGAQKSDRMLLDHCVPKFFQSGSCLWITTPQLVDHLSKNADLAVGTRSVTCPDFCNKGTDSAMEHFFLYYTVVKKRCQ